MLSRCLGCYLFAVGFAISAGFCQAQVASPADKPPPNAPVPVPYRAMPAPDNGPPVEPPTVLVPAVECPCDREGSWYGWFTGADVAVLFPSADIRFTGNGRLDLDSAVSPRVWFGYRFEQGGAVRLRYRNLDSSSTSG